MSKIMIDNWGLTSCMVNRFPDEYSNKKARPYYINPRDYYNSNISDLCWQNLLTSIILWDKVYFNYSQTNSIGDLETKFAIELLNEYVNNYDFDSITRPFELADYNYRAFHVCYPIEDYERKTISFPDIDEREELHRAIRYIHLANTTGCNYMPHPIRSQLLMKSKYFENHIEERNPNRIIYLESMDQYVKEYFEKLNELSGFQLKKVPFPVLYNYISANAYTPKEQLEFACELRNNKNVIKLRKSIDKVEDEFSKGNLLSYQASLLEIKEICDEITNKMYKKPKNISVAIGVSPSIALTPSITPSINVEFSIEIPKKISSSLHTTFLCDLANFAFTGKTKGKYT